MKTLVVPTIRETHIGNFLKHWKENWKHLGGWDENNDKIIVVEDNPTKTFNVDADYHFSWKEIEEALGDNFWIISRRNSAIRNYGFLVAYKLGADYIFTLDDDCHPAEGQNLLQGHLDNIWNTPVFGEAIPGYRTRGLAYRNRGVLDNVVLSYGLWTGDPDLDSVSMLYGQEKNVALPKSRVLPNKQYFPISSMNLAFKRSFVPLSYCPLNGLDQPFDRFDDIWCGIIAKKACDHLGWHIVCGEPYVYHSRASNAFDNLIKEASGIKYNETFWERINQIELSYKANTAIECMREISYDLVLDNDEYLKKLGRAIYVWTELLS